MCEGPDLILDLAAFLGADQLFSEIENDVRVNGMRPEYYRTLDTLGQFRLDEDGVIHSINVRFAPTSPLPGDLSYGEHVVEEPRQYRLAERFGDVASLAVSRLLRDSYFPTTWSRQRSKPLPKRRLG